MDSQKDNFFGCPNLSFFKPRWYPNSHLTLQIPMFPQNGLYRGPPNRRFYAFSRTSKNVVKMCILRIASRTLSQNTRDLLKNLTVAKNEFRKPRKLHSRSYSRPLLESACSRESDFYEFPLNSRRSTRKNVKSIEDYSVFRVPEDPTNPKFVEHVVFSMLISTSPFWDVAAETRGGKWSKTRRRSSISLNFGLWAVPKKTIIVDVFWRFLKK